MVKISGAKERSTTQAVPADCELVGARHLCTVTLGRGQEKAGRSAKDEGSYRAAVPARSDAAAL